MTHTATPVVTRFAPSPTGALHVGGARTALFNWAYAKRHGGQFLLRLEDTDRKRSSDASAQSMLDDLAWLGLTGEPYESWQGPGSDEGETPLPGVPTQSARHEKHDVYNQAIDKLRRDGFVQDEDGGAIRFLMGKFLAERLNGGPLVVNDEVFGEVRFDAKELEDFIIKKGEAGQGYPTYHLAVVVDDQDMGITHVIRGQEHLNNTPKHVALQMALEYRVPVYAHTPSIMNPDGSKMSKRDKAKTARKAWLDRFAAKDAKTLDDGLMSLLNIHELNVIQAKELGIGEIESIDRDLIEAFLNKENDDLNVADLIAKFLMITLPEINVKDFQYSGYLPEVLNNYLALLGWSPGDNTERFWKDRKDPLDFMAENFDLSRVGKANAKFDRDKLYKFNTEAIVELEPDDFKEKAKQHIRDSPQAGRLFRDQSQNEAWFDLFCKAVQERSRTLEEVFSQNLFLVQDHDGITYDGSIKPVKKAVLRNNGEGLNILEDFAKVLDAVDDGHWKAEHLHTLIEDYANEKGLKNMGSVAQPLRVALTGTTVSPPMDMTLELLGKGAVLQRIANCVTALRPSVAVS